MKFRVTLTYEYEPLPSDYDGADPSTWAEIDEENFNRAGSAQRILAVDLIDYPFKVAITPVKE
jgi:hypothetical protein